MRIGRAQTLVAAAASLAFIGLLAPEAYAVAGKIVQAPAGVSLAGGSLTLELEEPLPDGRTEVTVPVNDLGEFDVPPTVDQRKLKTCRYRDSKGDWHILPCAALFFGGAATTTAVAKEPTRALTTRLGRVFPRLDLTLAVGSAFGLSDTKGTSQSPFNSTTKSHDDLSGAAYSFTGRAFLPFKIIPKTSFWVFAQYDAFDGVKGSGGQGSHHPTPGEETEFTNQVKKSVGFGIGQQIQLGEHFYIGFKEGGAVVWQTITGRTDESCCGGRVETFSNDSTHLVPLLGFWGAKKLGDTPVSLVIGSDWRYLPSGSVAGASSRFGFPYRFSREGQWMMNVFGGLNVALYDTRSTW